MNEAAPLAPHGKFYKQIEGYTIVGLAVDEGEYGDIWEGLVLRKKNKEKVAWISRDPECNGPGFLDITEGK